MSETIEVASLNANTKPYHHGDLRRQLLDAAAVMMRSDGEAALSMRKLAQVVGVSRTAPYHHFSDKQALLCGVAEEGFRRFRDIVRSHPNGAETAIDLDTVLGFVRRYIDFAVNNAEYYDLMFGGHLWKSQQLTDSLKNEAYSTFKLYLEHIKVWQRQAPVSDFDALRYSQVSWSTLHGMSRLLIDGIYVDSAAIEAMSETAARMFWRELQPR
jgi:AcrR family transcriptional regulator